MLVCVCVEAEPQPLQALCALARAHSPHTPLHLPDLPHQHNVRQELTEDDAEKLAAMLEAQLGKPFDDITPEDMTADVTQKVRAHGAASAGGAGCCRRC